ncbi:helix-turn-helix domain-containing protein [Mesorhizobium sp. M1405]|uniref:helix-turn-helix domain-containing protein n=1 Tax=Mesorhizobium sp. M1405 TaxID=2957098 RepID=UPI0033359B29
MPDYSTGQESEQVGRMDGRSRCAGLPQTHGIAVYRDGEWAERGEVTLTEAAGMLNLSFATVLRQIAAGTIPAEQYCKGAPWVIKRRDIEQSHLIKQADTCPNGPPSSNLVQKTFVFQ